MHWLALPLQPENQPAVTTPAPWNEGLADVCSARIWWALRFTPLVAQVEGVLVLEISGSELLFGGRTAMAAHIFAENMPLAQTRRAHGATSLVAIGRLLHRHHCPPDALPVQVLAAARPHLHTLSRLGIRTWGQLRALPRGGVVRRFGTPLVLALDRAYGSLPEVYPWLTLPDVFDAPLELSASVESAPALLFGIRRLLAQLLVWLRARQLGILALELQWELDARRANTRHVDTHHDGSHTGRLVLRTAQATQDMTHLQRLLAEQLARVILPAPVLHVRLRSLHTQQMAGESRSLLPEDLRGGDSLHQTLERLAARLGPNQVRRAELLADHTPERMQRWIPCEATARQHLQPTATAAGCAAYLPGWLLQEPMPLRVQAEHPQYQGALELLAGPQRLEGGWLEGQVVLRDYYIACSPGAGLVWIYADRMQDRSRGHPQETGAGSGWFLHGLFA